MNTFYDVVISMPSDQQQQRQKNKETRWVEVKENRRMAQRPPSSAATTKKQPAVDISSQQFNAEHIK